MQFDDFKVKNHPKLSEVVYTTIKQRLISQRESISSGVKLQEDQLARELGVSRTPVREAIHKLEKDGLVHIIPWRGAFVRTISSRDVREIFDIRGALESLVVRSFLPCLNKKKLMKMRNLFEKCEGFIKKGELDFFVRLDEEFHDFLIKSSKNKRLIQIMKNLNDQIHLARLKSFSVPGRAKKAL
ncbi:MAG: GntR family transcriptional regulator, partial [bacterium]